MAITAWSTSDLLVCQLQTELLEHAPEMRSSQKSKSQTSLKLHQE
jgi:hypothetical protein